VECQEPLQGKDIQNYSKGVRKYRLDSVGVKEIRWEKGALKGQRILRFSMEKGMKIIS
jgi:hypothetical protein